jgi:hypothetical protein
MGTSLPKYLSYNPLPSSMSGLFIRDPSSNQQTPACVIHA